MAKLESLIVDMQVETAGLRKGLDDANDKLEKFGKKLDDLAGVVTFEKLGGLALEAAKKLGEFVLQGAEAADHMGKLASAAQVPVEEFQRIAYAAKLGGVSAEELGGAFNKLNKALGEAQLGGTKQVALFKALQVGLTDSSGAARDSGAIFKELAVKLNDMAPSFAKSTLEQELFGKSGAQLDETLKNIAEGLANAGGEADQFGQVLTGPAIAAITNFNDNVDRVKLAVQGIAQRVAANLAPAMDELTKQLISSASGADLFKEAADVLTGVIKVLVSGVIVGVGQFREMGAILGGIAAQVSALAHGEFTKAGDIAIDVFGEMKKIAAETADQVKAVWTTNQSAFKAAADAHKTNANSVLADMKRMEDAAKAMEARFNEAKQLADRLFEEHVIETDAAHKTSKISEDSVLRSEGFANIGKTADELIAQVTKGFKGFDDALEQYTQAQIGINNEQAAMAEAKKNKDAEGYDFAVEALENQERIAKKAGDAAEQFKILAEKAAQSKDTLAGAFGALAGAVLQAVPRLNELIQAAQQGAAVGGVWGALIAVFVQLISKTEAFQRIIDLVGGDLDQLVHGLEPLVNGIADLMDALDPITNIITSIIGSSLAPIGSILKILAPILKVVAEALALILSPIQALADFASQRFAGLGEVIGKISKVFDDAFKEIDKAIHSVENWIASITKSIPQQFVAVGTGTVVVKDPVPDTVPAAVNDLGTAAANTSTALDRLTSQFTNVPEGFRLNFRQFEATDPIGGAAAAGPPIQIIVQGSILTEGKLAQIVQDAQSKKGFQRSGKWP